jgi:hypothetical protein
LNKIALLGAFCFNISKYLLSVDKKSSDSIGVEKLKVDAKNNLMAGTATTTLNGTSDEGIEINVYSSDGDLYVSGADFAKAMNIGLKESLKSSISDDYEDVFSDIEFDYSKKWIQRCQGVPNGCIKEMARIFLKVTNVRVEKLQGLAQSAAGMPSIKDVAMMLMQGMAPEDLIKKGVPQELVMAALKMLKQQMPPRDSEAGLANTAVKPVQEGM